LPAGDRRRRADADRHLNTATAPFAASNGPADPE
jgi:hypothetical protein